MAFCFRVDSEGERSYRRVVAAVRETIDMYGLRATLRLIDAAPDIVHDFASGTKYFDANSLDFLVWGYSEHGQIGGQSTLRFRVHFDQLIAQPSTQHFEDMNLILGKRFFDIADQNDLHDYRVVARNLFEVCLLATALFLLQRNEVAPAVHLLETLYTSLRSGSAGDPALTSAQVRRLEELLHGGYSTLALKDHQRGDHDASGHAMARLRQLAPNSVGVLTRSAYVCYRVGDLSGAMQYTDAIRRLDRHSPIIMANNAFFGILERNYERAGFWYDQLRRSPRASEMNLPEIVGFLDGEYESRLGEHAFLYGIAIVHGIVDPQAGTKELRRFLRKAKGLAEYQPLVRRAYEILGEHRS